MNSDLLSHRVNEILGNVEASLCFPIILIIFFCTAHFIISHVLDIICSVVTAMDGSPDDADTDECTLPFIAKFRGILTNMACNLMYKEMRACQSTATLLNSKPIVRSICVLMQTKGISTTIAQMNACII